MHKKEISFFKKKLKEQKETLKEDLENYEHQSSADIKERSGELSSYDNHPADQASNTFDRERESGIQDNNRVLLDKTIQALEVIENQEQDYGICQNCGRKIDLERLKIVPHTFFCRECVAEREDQEDRPVEEEVISGFGDTNPQDKMIFDGEDTWEKIAEQGNSTNVNDSER
ncbi:MAG: TraR/DksA C4-type zinc finger protein [Bacillota bacterium]